jgi:hypothetical protein
VTPEDLSNDTVAPLTPGGADDFRPDEDLGDDETANIDPQVDYLRIVTWVIIIMSAVAAGIFYWQYQSGKVPVYQAPAAIMAFLERRHLPVPRILLYWAHWSEQAPIAKAFAAVNQSLRWLGKPQPPAATPAERAEKLRELLPEASEEIHLLTKEHQTALYSPRDGNLPVARQASQTIRYKTIKRLINRFFS